MVVKYNFNSVCWSVVKVSIHHSNFLAFRVLYSILSPSWAPLFQQGIMLRKAHILDHQWSFLESRSTVQHLSNTLYTGLELALENGQEVCAICFDFRKIQFNLCLTKI